MRGPLRIVGAALGPPLALAWLGHRIARRPARHIREVAEAPACGRPRVLCLGASITHGHVSYPWVDDVQGRLHDRALLINAGRNGSLAYNARRRLPHGLALGPRLVVVLVGTNDVHATTSAAQARTLTRMNHLPCAPDLAWFGENLAGIVDDCRKVGAEVALVTLPPLGEDPASRHNDHLVAANRVIADVAAARGADVIDLHARLLPLLHDRPVPVRPGPFGGLGSLLVTAGHVHLLGRTFDAVSARRGLHVTIDGIHLNERSGRILADLVEAWIAPRIGRADPATR